MLVMTGGLGVAANEKEKRYENVFEQYMYIGENLLCALFSQPVPGNSCKLLHNNFMLRILPNTKRCRHIPLTHDMNMNLL